MNRDLKALIAAVNAEPREMLPRMALADWWEEEKGDQEARADLCEVIRSTMDGWIETGASTVYGMLGCYNVPPIGVEITDREPWRNPNALRGVGRNIGPDGWLWLLPDMSRMELWTKAHTLPRPIFFLLQDGEYEERRLLKRYRLPDAGIRSVERTRDKTIADMNRAALAWVEVAGKRRADPKQMAEPRVVLT